jgi:hypothetical protein
LAGASTRSISVSGSAFVHVTDAVDTFALSGVTLGFWPELDDSFRCGKFLHYGYQRDGDAYWRHNLFGPWWRG